MKTAPLEEAGPKRVRGGKAAAARASSSSAVRPRGGPDLPPLADIEECAFEAAETQQAWMGCGVSSSVCVPDIIPNTKGWGAQSPWGHCAWRFLATACRPPPPPPPTRALPATQIRGCLLDWYDASHRVLPWRRNPHSRLGPEPLAAAAAVGLKPAPTDLPDNEFIYYEWVSEVMCQQTQISRAAEYFTRWVARWPTVQALAGAGQEQVNEAWAGLGYYRWAGGGGRRVGAWVPGLGGVGLGGR